MESSPDYTPIDCDLHDYIEIACLHRYQVRIRLRNGTELTGTAKTTQARRGVETLVLSCEGSLRRLRLDRLASLRVLSPNAVFRQLTFDPPPGPSVV